ncbi:hypothetical protein D3C75_755930 [compost metagenome]
MQIQQQIKLTVLNNKSHIHNACSLCLCAVPKSNIRAVNIEHLDGLLRLYKPVLRCKVPDFTVIYST